MLAGYLTGEEKAISSRCLLPGRRIRGNQAASALSAKLRQYINSVAGFSGSNWGGLNIRAAQIISRALMVAIPDGAASYVVEQAVQSGRRIRGNQAGTWKYVGRKIWVVLNNDGRVVSVGRN